MEKVQRKKHSQEIDKKAIGPRKAAIFYRNAVIDDLSSADFREHDKTISEFLSWCENRGIDDLARLSENILQQYVRQRERKLNDMHPNHGDIQVERDLNILKLFFEHCAEIGAVETELHESEVLSYDE
jgi:site-specific recombinase XerD